MSSQATEPNTCEVCGQKFNTPEELKTHKDQVHKGEAKPQ